MRQATDISENNQATVVYDGQCPVCMTFCKGLPQEIRLVDARKMSVERNEIERQQLNLDEGFVVIVNGELHHGNKAMAELAQIKTIGGWRGLVNRVFFSTERRVAVFYPLGKRLRLIALWLTRTPLIHAAEHNIIRYQLGDSWQRLKPAIQQRFGDEPALGESVVYVGSMSIIRRSRAGWLFAHLTRIIGNPLTPYAGENVPMQVALFRSQRPDDVGWQRSYFYEGRKPFVVTSVKCENHKNEMMERVGWGFGMKLKVYVQEGDLHFRSYRYFWLGLPLPHWLTPGQTHVVHADNGDGSFTFSITMRHPLLGETFYQTGQFSARK